MMQLEEGVNDSSMPLYRCAINYFKFSFDKHATISDLVGYADASSMGSHPRAFVQEQELNL